MNDSRVTASVRRTLADDHVHAGWERAYRSSENERFYERAFAHILDVLNPPPGARWLDVGCGPGFHAMRLARLGYRVDAVDFSAGILRVAQANVSASGLDNVIRLTREDVTALTLADASQDYVLAWGVLMHVPEVDQGIAELARIIRPGGVIVVSEGNADGLDARVAAMARRLRGRPPLPRTSAGIELWKDTPAGSFLTRRANIESLVRGFRSHGLVLRRRAPGQLSELYARAPVTVARRIIHVVNHAWFALDGPASIATGNVLIFVRPG